VAVLILFLDGVGLGSDDSAVNPFSRASLPEFQNLLGKQGLFLGNGIVRKPQATLVPTDATLGVDGLPQSATGQTALLTGINAAQHIGMHTGPWPGSALRQLLSTRSLFRAVTEKGGSPYFANAYPQRYFDTLGIRRRQMSAIPFAAQSSGLELLRYEAICAGTALSADFTGQGWRDQLGYEEIPLLSPFQAGTRLALLAQQNTLTVYDYWLPDLTGHAQRMADAVRVLEMLDQVLSGVLHLWDHHRDLLVITSDHGNIEDLSRKTHTYNPVPAIFVGAGHQDIAAQVHDLTDIASTLLSIV